MPHRVKELIHTLHQHKILPGDRIAAYLPNGQLLIDLLFATWHIGANLCPLNRRLPPQQIENHLHKIDPKLYVTEEGFFPRNSEPTAIYSSLFLFTSGSTGIPKIAVLSRETLLANAKEVISRVDLNYGDRWLLSLPLFHVGGIGILLRCLLAGAKASLDPHNPLITHVSFVPTQLFRTTPIYKNLRCLLLGGAPANEIPLHLPIYLTYGLTEMGSLVTARLNPPCIEGFHYLGHPLKGREMKLGVDGEIWVKGACLFQGYWENKELVLPLEEGWFATGDLGRYCPKEGFAVCGRKDWQFISGGENIQPEEIERALLQCPEVQEAVVIPKIDREYGFRPVAVVRTMNKDFNLEKMKGALKDSLPKYKIPIAIHEIEEFPRKGLKVDRKNLLNMINKAG